MGDGADGGDDDCAQGAAPVRFFVRFGDGSVLEEVSFIGSFSERICLLSVQGRERALDIEDGRLDTAL